MMLIQTTSVVILSPKAAIVETELGQVRVTSRPGMHGVVSGILLEE